MANLKIFCVIVGETKSFSVKVPSDDTVDDLKDAIKAKKSNYFDLMKIDADQLTLWRVSLPDDDDLPTLLKSLNDKQKLSDFLSDKEKLKATTKLSNIFDAELPEDTIHIIVQLPQSVVAAGKQKLSEAFPNAIPISKRSVPYESIGNELTQIIEDASRHHVGHTVDATDVETAQKEKLGPFYKKTLPYGTTANSMNLAMLGILQGKEPMSDDNRTLREIVESDIGKTTDLSVVAMVGRSGSGKTATVIDLARRHFVVYCVCSSPRSLGRIDFKDRNFSTLAKDVEQMCQALSKPSSSRQRLDNDSRLKRLAGDRVELEFLARLLFLQLLLNNDAQLTPEQFFREQTNGGATTIGALVEKLRMFEASTIRSMLNFTQDKLAVHLNRQRQGLVVALDEAQIAESHILPREFISSNATNKTDELLDSKGELKEEYCRGFLTPLCAALGDVRATLVVLGTALSLQNVDHVYSAVSKRTNIHRIMQFPSFDDQEVENVLSNLIDTSSCTLPHAKRRKLTGRARFSVSVIRELFELRHIEPLCKQAKLDQALESAINQAKGELRDKVRSLLHNDRDGNTAHLFSRMVLAYKLQGGKIWFTSNSQADFVDKALCRLRMDNDCVHWLMDEPLVVEVVEEELRRSNVDPFFLEYLSQLDGIIANLGVKSSTKGNALEPLVRQSLRRFCNFRLKDLPFLKDITLPAWCNRFKLQIDEINTAHGFGMGTDNTEADLKFLIDRPSNKLLVEQSGTRQDGAWFFSDKCFAGSLAIKFYSNDIPRTHHVENETSSDIRCSFLQNDGAKENKSLKNIREKFVASGVPNDIKGILRIHLEFPRVQGGTPTTHVKTDSATGIEDVMVYIDLSNMDTFFYEGIEENKQDIIRLKRLIAYVAE